MDKQFFVDNRQALGQALEEGSILLLFAGKSPKRSADQNYPFTPNRNFYYMCGLDVENPILMLQKSDGVIKERVYIEESDPVMAKWIGENITVDATKERTGIEEVKFLKSFEQDLNGLLSTGKFTNLYLDLERRSMNEPNTIAQEYAAKLGDKYRQLRIQDIFRAIAMLRVYKKPQEVQKLREAIDITAKGIKSLMLNSKPWMYEYQLEGYYNFETCNHGGRIRAFDTIAASGKNATVLHYVTNDSVMQDGDLVLFDLGVEKDYYCADISRTFPVNGRFSERQKEVYNVVLDALKAVISQAKTGLPYSELNKIATKSLAEGCKRIGLIKEDSEISKYYYHGVSHYLGLDTHDVGYRDLDLAPGMVLTVEPGLYIEEESIGVRIEDDILITDEGCEVLSKDIPREIDDIERIMNK